MTPKWVLAILVFACFAFSGSDTQGYASYYKDEVHRFVSIQQQLLALTESTEHNDDAYRESLKKGIARSRMALKRIDFWLRYFEPVAYKKVNGPLPVEWEVEVFEKFEPPYKREGAGLTLAETYLDEGRFSKDSMAGLIRQSLSAMETYLADSITVFLDKESSFYFANRLYLLNLAAIYTTGYECPDTAQVIPELRCLMQAVGEIYTTYNRSFPQRALPAEYLDLYAEAADFVLHEPDDFTCFDHFRFIRQYVNPLFKLNQALIRSFRFRSSSYVDYSLNEDATSIFDKRLYTGQQEKGLFFAVEDTAILKKISQAGRLLFYDPLLSGNNRRSCASCHKPASYFADSSAATPLAFDGISRLPRNAPSLINAVYNHLLMLDGKHISLQAQARDVISNPHELNGNEKDILSKVMSCREYRELFHLLLAFTPEEKEVTMGHIISAITFYYSQFSRYASPFDQLMDISSFPDDQWVRAGFNLFMGKAQCATCHFVPQFNGVKPPYTGSEFEVLGVPADTAYRALSADSGRFGVHPVSQMARAFRTGTIRNSSHTQPYMHNGVFRTLWEVVDFYDRGGGAGRSLDPENQTLEAASLNLTETEKELLVRFMESLTEKIEFEKPPENLPLSDKVVLNKRKPGGEY